MKEESVKKIHWLIGIALVLGIVIGTIGTKTLNAQNPLEMGTELQRTSLVAAPEWEGILIMRDVPGGGESGWHTQSGNEVVYIVNGSVILEVKGKPAQTIKAGEAFTTAAGDVHNVKNASKTDPVKAAAFYIAKKGTKMEDLSAPAK
jgi:quercetin dioxygenase-like cupin family protein